MSLWRRARVCCYGCELGMEVSMETCTHGIDASKGSAPRPEGGASQEPEHLRTYRVLLPNLSPLLVREILSAPTTPSVRYAFQEGSVLFTDISGFSRISEALSSKGRAGAEEMTGILDGYFAELLRIALLHGGEPAKFSGDALLLCFAGHAHSERAARCALSIQEAMEGFAVIRTSRGDYSLAVHCGADSGLICSASVGRPGERHEYLISGPAVAGALAAHELAGPGEVVIAASMATLLGSQAKLSPVWEGYHFLQHIEHIEVPEGTYWFDPLRCQPTAGQVAMLASYLPGPVIERIVAQRDSLDLLAEHRPAAIMFVNFRGWDRRLSQNTLTSADAALEELERYLAMVEHTVQYYGGIVARCDHALQGDRLLVLFGAPVSHQNDAEHAIRCALDLNAHLGELEVRIHQHIGIATGHVFSGNVGSSWCREYTVIGDAANLAARLMSKANEGEILVSASTLSGLEGRALADSLPPLTIKGFSEPVQYYRVVGWAARPAGWLPSQPSGRLIDRQSELAQLQTIMNEVREGPGQVIAIVGQAGVGKSALSDRVARTWRELGGTVHVGSCEAYGKRIPYLPWIGVLESLFDLASAGGAEARRRQVVERVRQWVPDWEGHVHILTGLMGLASAKEACISDRDPWLYQQRLHCLVAALLSACTQAQPLMVMITDLHWADQATLMLIKHLVHDTPSRFLLLLSYRPDLTQGPNIAQKYTELVLEGLPRQDCQDLACALLGSAGISDDLAQQLWSFSRGNPLYLREMLNHLITQGHIVRDKAGAYRLQCDPATLPVPASIERIIISRLDQLEDASRRALKLAAVVGRVFAVRALQALYPYPLEQTQAVLDSLASQVLIRIQQTDPEPVYAFCEPQVQEIIYAALSYAQRQALHAQLGRFFEQQMVAQQPERYALLAYHYDLGQELAKAFQYHLKAGDEASQKYANTEALYHYERALELAPQLSTPPETHTLVGLYRDHGRVCRFLGASQKAQESYERGLALALQHDDLLGEAEILTWQSDLWLVQGEGNAVLDRARRAAELAEQLGDKVLLELALEYVGGGYMLKGALDDALSCFERCLKQSPSPRGALRSRNNIGLIHVASGRYSQAAMAFAEALGIARELQDYFYIIILANNLGELYQELYDSARAMALHQEALSMAHRLGIKDFEADCLRNLAIDLAQLGDHTQALKCLSQARMMVTEIHFVVGEAAVLYSMGEIYLAQGNHSEAAAAARILEELAEQVQGLRQKSLLLSGLVQRARGQYAQAQATLESAVALWEQEPRGPSGWQTYQALGEIYQEQGQAASAQEAFARARSIVASIAQSVADERLRTVFLEAPPVRRVLTML